MVNNLKHFDTFQDIVKRYKDLYDIDLSNLKYIEDNVARNNNGSIANIPSDEFGGSWLKDHSIIINPDPEPVIKHYGLSMQAKDFLRHIMAHEMAHDVSYNPKYKDLYKKMVEEAKAKKFTTPYMDVVPEDKYDNELFSEYMAHLINEKKASALLKIAKLLTK